MLCIGYKRTYVLSTRLLLTSAAYVVTPTPALQLKTRLHQSNTKSKPFRRKHEATMATLTSCHLIAFLGYQVRKAVGC